MSSLPCSYSKAVSHTWSRDEVNPCLAFVDIICSAKPVHRVKICGSKSAGVFSPVLT